MKMINIFMFILGNILCTAIALFGYHFFITEKPKIQELREETTYSYINPLLECNVEFEYYNPKKLQNTLSEYIQKQIETTEVSQVSYYARLLKNGATFGYEEDQEYTPASLIKLPLSIAFLKHMSFSQLQKKIVVTKKSDDILQRNFGSDTIEVGKEYTFGQLFTAMLSYSDNTAALTLINFLGFDPIYKVYEEFGLENLDFADLGSINISTKSYAAFFRMLYNASYIPRDDSEYILSLLVKGNFKSGIAQFIPRGIQVANKFGERKNPLNGETQLHDCGIVYAKETPYILCIMTRGGDFDQQLDVIQNISKMVYETLTSM